MQPHTGGREWQRTRTNKGYAAMVNGHSRRHTTHAHRFAYEQHHGIQPWDYEVDPDTGC